jgi:hypothetical protein
VRRIQIYIDEPLDDALEAEARRRGLSKAALIRASVGRDLLPSAATADDPWRALTGWLDDDPIDDIDAVIYGPAR